MSPNPAEPLFPPDVSAATPPPATPPPRPKPFSFVWLIAMQLLLGSGWLAEALLSELHKPPAPGAAFRGGAGILLLATALLLLTRSYLSLGLVATLDAFGALLLLVRIAMPNQAVSPDRSLPLDTPVIVSALYWPIFLISIPGLILTVSHAISLYRQKEALDTWRRTYGGLDPADQPADPEAENAETDAAGAELTETAEPAATGWDQAPNSAALETRDSAADDEV